MSLQHMVTGCNLQLPETDSRGHLWNYCGQEMCITLTAKCLKVILDENSMQVWISNHVTIDLQFPVSLSLLVDKLGRNGDP